MRLLTFLFVTSSLAWIFLVAVAQQPEGAPADSTNTTTGVDDDAKETTNITIPDNPPDTKTDESSGQTTINDNTDTEQSDETQESDENSGEIESEEKEEDIDEKSGNTTDSTVKKDDLNDNPEVVDPNSISDDTNSRFHTVKLMLYIIAPVSALVVVYFIMKGLKGNSRMFLNRYHLVGAGTRGDSIELRPLDYESDEEDEDVVFDSSRHT